MLALPYLYHQGELFSTALARPPNAATGRSQDQLSCSPALSCPQASSPDYEDVGREGGRESIIQHPNQLTAEKWWGQLPPTPQGSSPVPPPTRRRVIFNLNTCQGSPTTCSINGQTETSPDQSPVSRAREHELSRRSHTVGTTHTRIKCNCNKESNSFCRRQPWESLLPRV